MLGFALLTVFIAHLLTTLTRRDGTWLPTAMLVGGISTVALKLSTSAAWLVTATMRVGELSGEIGQTLDDIGAVGFKMTFFTIGLFVAAAAASLFRSGLTARWVSWTGGIVGLACMGTVNLALDSDMSIPPFMLSLLWIFGIGVFLLVREIRHR